MLRRIFVAVYLLGFCYLFTWVPFTVTYHTRAVERAYYHQYRWLMAGDGTPELGRILLRVLAWTAFAVAAYLVATVIMALRRSRPSDVPRVSTDCAVAPSAAGASAPSRPR